MAKHNKNKPMLGLIKEQTKPTQSNLNQDEDFDYLNDDDEYQEDYQDYEEPEDKPAMKQESRKEVPSTSHNSFNKNTFLTYCKEYEESNEEEGGAEWDLEMDDDADFV